MRLTEAIHKASAARTRYRYAGVEWQGSPDVSVWLTPGEKTLVPMFLQDAIESDLWEVEATQGVQSRVRKSLHQRSVP